MATEATATSKPAAAAWESLRQFQRDALQRLNIEDEELARASIAAAEAADLRYDSSSSSDTSASDGDENDEAKDVTHDDGNQPAGKAGGVNPSTMMGSAARAAKRRELREALLARSIPLPFLVDYLQQRRSATRLVLDLILFVPLLFLALNLFVFRSDVSSMSMDGSYYAQALRTLVVDQEVSPQGYHLGDPNNDVNGPHHLLTFASVRTVAEWQLWLGRVVVPTFYNFLHRDAQPSRDGPLSQCVLASAIRLRTFRVTNHSCTVPPSLVSRRIANATVPCYGPYNDDVGIDATSLFEFNTTGIGGGSAFLAFEPVGSCGGYHPFLLKTRAEYASYACGGFTTLLNGSLTFTEALAHADAWGASGVLSNAATRFVSVDVVLYNTALDVHLLAEFSHEVTEGGAWYPYPRLTLFRVLSSTAYPVGQRVSDAFLALFLIVAWARFFSQWVLAFQENRRSIGAYFFDPWTIVNATYLVCVTVTLVLTWVQAGLADDTKNASVLRSAPQLGSVFSYELVRLARLAHWTRYFMGVASVMMFLKVIEFVRLNSRLNILTRTLARVAEAVVGVLALFCLFMIAFALSGHVLFGATMHAYSTFAMSFSTSMLALMGTFDYAALRSHDPRFAFVYFFSFVILGLFVLLQFITAVIGTAFDEERLGVRVLPLSSAIAHFLQRWGSYDRVRERFHLYVRCVKAFHSVSPNVLWNRVCQHVETAVALDAMLRAKQQHQRRQQAAGGAILHRRSDPSHTRDPLASNTGAAATPSLASPFRSSGSGFMGHSHHAMEQHHLVGLSFLVGAIGKDDVAVLTLPQVESIFLDATRAHDRIRPSAATAEHWSQLDMVEGVVADRIHRFMASPGIVGRIERKSKRITGSNTDGVGRDGSRQHQTGPWPERTETRAHDLLKELEGALSAAHITAATTSTARTAASLEDFVEDASARLAAVLTQDNVHCADTGVACGGSAQRRGTTAPEHPPTGVVTEASMATKATTDDAGTDAQRQLATLRQLQRRLDTAVRSMALLRAAVPDDAPSPGP